MRRLLGLFCCLVLLIGTRSALALESTPTVTPQTAASLVSDTDRAEAGAVVRLGLLLRLAPGWHVYWKNPGEAGVAPELRLKLPEGARAGPIAWPAPAALREGPLLVYGYSGDVLLPVSVITPAHGAGLSVRAEADWLVCKDICIPEQGAFRLDLPPGKPAPSAEAALFAKAERATPRKAPWDARIAPDGTLSLTGAELGPATVADAVFVPDQEGTIVDAAPQSLRLAPGGLALKLKPGSGFHPEHGLSGIVLLRDPAGFSSAVQVQARPGPVPPILAARRAGIGRLWGLAFAGGLILNLMPCVFPVLAMKILGLAGSARRGKARGEAVSYALGVLASFLALGGALMLLRGGLGDGVGWGFQFTAPGFVAFMAWVMLAIGLNLSGLFTVSAGRLAGAGQGLAKRGGHAGSFGTGLLAVLVASPCTAPFMAGAVAGALAAPPAATLSVFAAMGLGLAAPYVALAWLPGLARLLPRPGAWMEALRRVLALPMYAAAAWLLWVLKQEAGEAGLLIGLAGGVLVLFGCWIFGFTQNRLDRLRGRGALLAGVAVLAALALLPEAGSSAGTIGEARSFVAGGEAFTPARLAALRAEGRPVFVDVTASWCLTCLVNERVALGTAPVQQAFRERQVALLVADWTRQDPELTGFLRENGRDGVPLYLFYPPRRAEPVVLPQILTPQTVLAVIPPHPARAARSP